jgi:hypothetical protein
MTGRLTRQLVEIANKSDAVVYHGDRAHGPIHFVVLQRATESRSDQAWNYSHSWSGASSGLPLLPTRFRAEDTARRSGKSAVRDRSREVEGWAISVPGDISYPFSSVSIIAHPLRPYITPLSLPLSTPFPLFVQIIRHPLGACRRISTS